jgi:hypothetical protein
MDAKPVAITLMCRVCGSRLESEFQQNGYEIAVHVSGCTECRRREKRRSKRDSDIVADAREQTMRALEELRSLIEQARAITCRLDKTQIELFWLQLQDERAKVDAAEEKPKPQEAASDENAK